MLWKKELGRENASYTNIFASIGNEDEYDMRYRVIRGMNMNPNINKSDEKAFEARMYGNNKFKNKKWNEAMVSYNASLCLAEEGSEHISLAYANRSTCFYRLEKYKECLVDIKLAREAGYPQNLMPKLDKREADCLQHIEAGATKNETGLKLCSNPKENFPNFANILEFSPDENGIPSLVATEDIDVGQIVAVESFFNPYVFDRLLYYGVCNICSNTFVYTNMVPCSKCTNAMFCQQECQHKALHQFECGSRFCDDDKLNGNIMRVVRTILLAINLFPNVDELMGFTEDTVNSDPNEIPHTLSDAKSKYRTFLKLPFKKTFDNDLVFRTFCVYMTLLEHPEVNTMFQAEQRNRFLMHLICHHTKVSDTYLAQIETTKGMIALSHIEILQKYFKLSCAPNLMRNSYKGSLGYITARPIKKGEHLTMSTFDIQLEPKEKREKKYEEFDYICTCARCEGVRPSPEQKRQLDLDPLYRSILLNNAAERSVDRINSLVDKCEMFLRKYGGFPWCEEIGRVMGIYKELVCIRYTSDETIMLIHSPQV